MFSITNIESIKKINKIIFDNFDFVKKNEIKLKNEIIVNFQKKIKNILPINSKKN